MRLARTQKENEERQLSILRMVERTARQSGVKPVMVAPGFHEPTRVLAKELGVELKTTVESLQNQKSEKKEAIGAGFDYRVGIEEAYPGS